ncbi:hypothetical protein DL766_010134 [Monosporascus sp. MC13-8B]|uniref:SPX domain-containing protein n=1 Tax=Monosporascus cannonballus TaxID=155416 RepID=A0ABY0H366_9PEZI|nr:hypothetical protein DL762_007571 [Monosporascus cannonballus]RYO99480.1 hypothetical protein DL763_001504 [Monosporascus cannonballus]RYP09651.1 hypothetical protein DL766_010134 [Monosporascus sp. MC13-8B]
MKFGQHLEQQSVPGWSIHNVDYNSLKHQIKTHTIKDQASAIAIPGQQDPALKRFEDSFYFELCRQHDRVCLFVSSKCDEIHWRLRHISDQVNRLILQCTDNRGLTVKRQQRFAKYRQQIDECGDDIKALGRFVEAQIVAFRKILKKYKKWTRSATLSIRFKDNVLNSPKSFTNRDFSALRTQFQDVLATVEAASPARPPDARRKAQPGTPSDTESRRGRRLSLRPPAPAATTPSPTPAPVVVGYWNEYEHGSEAGDYGAGEDTYAIYVDPNETADFPGLHYIKSIVTAPGTRIRGWLRSSRRTTAAHTPETQSLLNHRGDGGSPRGYFATRNPGAPASLSTENEGTTEDEYASSSEAGPSSHYHNHDRNRVRDRYAADPEAAVYCTDDDGGDQELRLARYRDRMLGRAVVLGFAASFALLAVSGALVATGRHRLRLEVDAGAAAGSVASLSCACLGLGALFARGHGHGEHKGGGVPLLYSLAVWAAFAAAALLNAMLLVIVVRR